MSEVIPGDQSNIFGMFSPIALILPRENVKPVEFYRYDKRNELFGPEFMFWSSIRGLPQQSFLRQSA
jgi:hypothetical protein